MTEAEAGAVRASVASNSEAARLYAQGLAKLRVFDALGARELFGRAVAADPNYALAHSALAEAWGKSGYDEKSKEEAKKAFDLSASLPREQRLLIEARYREAAKDWDRAIQIYQTLFSFLPDNLEYGLKLALVQSQGNRSSGALATIATLRKLQAPAGEDPRIDLAGANVAYRLSDLRRAASAASRAAQKGEAEGA